MTLSPLIGKERNLTSLLQMQSTLHLVLNWVPAMVQQTFQHFCNGLGKKKLRKILLPEGDPRTFDSRTNSTHFFAETKTYFYMYLLWERQTWCRLWRWTRSYHSWKNSFSPPCTGSVIVLLKFLVSHYICGSLLIPSWCGIPWIVFCVVCKMLWTHEASIERDAHVLILEIKLLFACSMICQAILASIHVIPWRSFNVKWTSGANICRCWYFQIHEE